MGWLEDTFKPWSIFRVAKQVVDAAYKEKDSHLRHWYPSAHFDDTTMGGMLEGILGVVFQRAVRMYDGDGCLLRLNRSHARGTRVCAKGLEQSSLILQRDDALST